MASSVQLHPLVIDVDPATKIFGLPDAYKNDSVPRGGFYIANWKHFRNNKPRYSSDKDVKNMKTLFEQSGYTCVGILKENASRKDFLEDLVAIRSKPELSNFDSFVGIFMSHGNASGFISYDEEIITPDEVCEHFNDRDCPLLRGKPKVFFFEHCRGPEETHVSEVPCDMNAGGVGQTPAPIRGKLADIYKCFSSLPNHASYSDPLRGAAFIEHLCRIYNKRAKDTEIYKMIPLINENLEKTPFGQSCEFTSMRHSHDFYFNPRRSLCPDKSSSSQMTQQFDLGATGGASPSVSDSKGAEASATSMGASGATCTDPSSSSGGGGTDVSPADKVYSLNNDPKGWVCMWNNIAGCEGDTRKLEGKFKELGYKVIHMPKIDSYDQLVDYFEKFQITLYSPLIVFFFGFGYGENIFIGTGEAESLSYRKLCEVIRAKQKDRKPIVVFTNTCLKPASIDVVCQSKLDKPVRDTFHLCVKVEGECKKGSLLTEALLQELEENKGQLEIYNMWSNIWPRIDEMAEVQQVLYEPEFRCYGILKFFHFSFPSQVTPLEAAVDVQTIIKEDRDTGSSSEQKHQSKETPAIASTSGRSLGASAGTYTEEISIHKAAFDNNLERVEKLIHLGCNINEKERTKGKGSSRGNELVSSLLIQAAETGRMATVQELIINSGADPNHRDLSSSLTSEETAHQCGQSDVAWFLNKYTEGKNRPSGSRPEWKLCKSKYGFNSIEEMQSGKDETCIHKASLDAGFIDLHFQDEEGMTHLHTAVKKNQLEEISLLLERGALATALTHDGVTPHDLAIRHGSREEAADKIKEHLKKFTENELKSPSEVSNYYTSLLSLIVDWVSLSSRYKDDDIRAEQEKQKILKKASWLLSLGVPLEPPGNYYTHALHLAITCNCKSILTLLLAAGAPLYATQNGLGPVEVAWLTPDVTTWIGVTVTRAVMNKLKAEVKGFNIHNETDRHVVSSVENLLIQLDGQKPWQANFSCPNKYLNGVLGAACGQGATLIAWWVWRAGGCCLFQRGKDGKTALHITLDGKHYQTALALVQYMDANAFLPDKEGRLPIDLFPERNRDYVIKDSLVMEYRALDGVLQRAIDSSQTTEAKDLILLLLTLVMMWKFNQYKTSHGSEWKIFYMKLISFLHSFDIVYDTLNWIPKLNEKLKEIHPDVLDKGRKQKVRDQEIDDFLHELNSRYYSDDDSDSLDTLIHLLEPLVRDFITSGRSPSSLSVADSKRISDKDINRLLKKGLEMCSGKKLPMFLHLLVSNAKVDPRIIIDRIANTDALHLAAINGNMSAASYLLRNGASLSKQDICGRTPSHFAYMHGHKPLGDLLNTHPEIASKNGSKPTDLWQAYNKYLYLYDLDLKEESKTQFSESNNSDDLIRLHLNYLKIRWSKLGIRETVRQLTVDYTKGEACEVKDAVQNILESLISEVGKLDSRFDAELTFVGSSADNVHLLTPDEYDCNVVFKNFSGYPDGGCQIHLRECSADDRSLHTYKDMEIRVSTKREDLKGLFEERKLLIRFRGLIIQCLPKIPIDDPRLSISCPSVKLTQVGVGLRFAWNGKEFPLLLIDVDVVPTMKAPWPTCMEKTKLLPDMQEVLLNTVGRNEWRFSTAQAEKRVMECLSHDERFVFLACKVVMSSLKTKGWVPQHVKDRFKYWDGQMLKIPLPKGSILKNCFLYEKEVTNPRQWEEDKWIERMSSIFKRMCCEMEKEGKLIFVPGKIPSYFARSTEEQGVGYGAPPILAFLQDFAKGV